MRKVTVVATCEKCGKQSTSIDGDMPELKLCTVGVYVEDPNWDGRLDRIGKGAEWCRECCEAAGLLKPRKTPEGKEEQPPAQPPSIEEMLRLIAREEAQDAAGVVGERLESYVNRHERFKHQD